MGAVKKGDFSFNSAADPANKYFESSIRQEKSNYLNRVHKDILQRASSFLLLKDSKASFSIEGENPRNNRAARWGIAIGQAGYSVGRKTYRRRAGVEIPFTAEKSAICKKDIF